MATIPVAAVYGIAGGAPKLGVVHQTGPDAAPVVASPTVATTFVNGTAGNLGAMVDNLGCGTPANCGNLTIFFSVGATNLVTFSGAQFNLYLSKDGFSLLSPGDIKYAGSFLVSSLATALVGVVEQNGTYYIGTTTSTGICVPGCKVVEGPLPIQIAGGFKFIKVWDGTAVAALQYITIAPGIRLNPTSGPANRPVQVMGGGFTPSILIDLNYSYTFHAWPAGGASAKAGQWQTSVDTTSNGYFNYTFNMIDTKQAVNPTGGPFNDPITIKAVKHTYPHTLMANIAPPATPAVFTEKSRVFTQVISFNQRGDLVVNNTAGSYYGNDTGIAPIIPQPSCTGGTFGVPVFATGTLWLAGNWWTWGGNVTFWVSNSTSTGFHALTPSSTTAGNSSAKPGWFGVNLTVPTNLVIGTHTVKVVSNGVAYTFLICMNPTLILNPFEGTASNPSTTVTVSAYGFPAGKLILLYWNGTSFGDDLEFNVANGTTGTDGQFNTTVTFPVPETYGGDHNVTAWRADEVDFYDVGYGICSGTSPLCESVVPNHGGGCVSETVESFEEEMSCEGVFPVATAAFTVLPSFVVIPGNFSANYGQEVVAVGEGFIPGVFYSVDIDNQQADFSTTFLFASTGVNITTTPCPRITGHVCHFGGGGGGGGGSSTNLTSAFLHGLVTPDNLGLLNLTFTGAGFRPGLHVISLTGVDAVLSAGSYGPDATALFTVNTDGDPIASMLTSMTATLNSITATLSSIGDSLSSIQSSLSTIDSEVTALQTSVNTLSSTVGDIQTTVNSINSWATSAQTTLSSIQSDLSSVKSDVSSIKSSVTSIGSDVSSIKNSVSGVSGIGSTANSILSAVQAEQTYVLVVAVLAAITLVLVLAVLIRRLS
ncbi:MAG: hypothetical protein HY296_06670 [Thaumarchaeota archaeon]|nr:hypothetical protein [Nitrososphaerota archaeon]